MASVSLLVQYNSSQSALFANKKSGHPPNASYLISVPFAISMQVLPPQMSTVTGSTGCPQWQELYGAMPHAKHILLDKQQNKTSRQTIFIVHPQSKTTSMDSTEYFPSRFFFGCCMVHSLISLYVRCPNILIQITCCSLCPPGSGGLAMACTHRDIQSSTSIFNV